MKTLNDKIANLTECVLDYNHNIGIFTEERNIVLVENSHRFLRKHLASLESMIEVLQCIQAENPCITFEPVINYAIEQLDENNIQHSIKH